jgi:hypothetical protein
MRARKFLVETGWWMFEVFALLVCCRLVFGAGGYATGQDMTSESEVMFFAAVYCSLAMRSKGYTL